jgi:predicted RNA-binding Zn-ribbon protein involved in translation (DUF1610 family)
VATVRASCPNCGDIELSAQGVEVVRFAPDPSSFYSFSCPQCTVLVTRPATSRVVDLLVSAGVQAMTFTRPAELDEIHDGPPITYDDLLNFHYEVSDGGWLDTLTGA